MDLPLSSAKRRDLFRSLELATGREVVLLSSPPKGKARAGAGWIPSLETRFATHRQFVCANWDMPKLRIPCSWFFYALQLVRHARSGDIVLFDNYEFIYVLAARVTRLVRRLRFVLDFEDGKHLIDRSVWKLLSLTAEKLGRPLIDAAFVAHPALEERLPRTIPRLLVPGFVSEQVSGPRFADGTLRFLYCGSLDVPRGIDILLAALSHLPEAGWRLEISGDGELAGVVKDFADQPAWKNRVTFHGTLSNSAFNDLIGRCHVGVNCQRAADAISEVTFPSKLFTYLSAGLLVISSRASGVSQILGAAASYYDGDSPAALGRALREMLSDFDSTRRKGMTSFVQVQERFSVVSTSERIRTAFVAAGIL